MHSKNVTNYCMAAICGEIWKQFTVILVSTLGIMVKLWQQH